MHHTKYSADRTAHMSITNARHYSQLLLSNILQEKCYDLCSTSDVVFTPFNGLVDTNKVVMDTVDLFTLTL